MITIICIIRKGGTDLHISFVLTSGGATPFIMMSPYPKGGVIKAH
jgi:hypothetical protein